MRIATCAVALAIECLGCSKRDPESSVSSSGISFQLAPAAFRAVPQIGTSSSGPSKGTSTVDFGPNNPGLRGLSDKFFRLGCHNSQFDFCPAAIAATADNKFDDGCLIGMIAAVDRQLPGVYNRVEDYSSCMAGEPHAELTDHQLYFEGPSGEKTPSNRFVVGLHGILDCIGYFDTSPGVHYNTAYAKAADRTRLAGVFASSNDLYEMYVRLDPGATGDAGVSTGDAAAQWVGQGHARPVVAAVNHVMRNNSGGSAVAMRAVLMYNGTSHRFVLKTKTPEGGDIVAVGIGGFDDAQQTWASGSYLLRAVVGGETPDQGVMCMSNDGSGTVDPQGSACAWLEQGGYIVGSGETWTVDVAKLLDLDATDLTVAGNFVSLLGSADVIEESGLPSSEQDLPWGLAAKP